MRTQHPTPNAYPAHLLDEQLRVLLRASPAAPATAALHTRSVDARALVAHAAGAASVAGLIAAAHHRPGGQPTVSRLDPFAVGELARVLALQDLRADDRADALALFELVLTTFGAHRVDPAHQGLHCQLAFAAGQRERVAALLDTYPAIPEAIRAALRIDLANPYAGGAATPQEWLDGFRELFPDAGLGLAPGPGPAFDRLATDPGHRIGSPHRITTIVTTYRPGPALLSAVRSLVRQSWTNHEILVVDDGSPPSCEPVLRAAAALDPRVRLLRLPVNSGTYLARNVGLDAATGEFVTFADSDDLSHPWRLERQVQPLISEPDLFATTSVGMRVTANLVVTRAGFAQTRSYNLSSLMLRRQCALRELGYLDAVRKGADAEYVERARAVFGRPAVRHLTGAPLALVRLSPTSLSGTEIRAGWLHPARRAYLSAFTAWHRRVADGVRSPRLSNRPAARAFAAPRRLTGETDARVAYDVILLGDWSAGGGGAGGGGAGGEVTPGAAAVAAGRMRALTARGLRVAVLHLDAITNLADGPRHLDPAVQDLVNAGTVEQVVLSDEVWTEVLVVASPAVLHFAPGDESLVRADVVVIEVAGPTDRLAPQICAATARRLFGVDPFFAPRGPHGRRLIDAATDSLPLAAVDLPGTVDTAEWRLDRRGPRSDRPVLGRLCGTGRAEWRLLRETLPDSAHIDVRLLTVAAGAATALGRSGPPGNWLIYEPAESSLRSFLFQVDFYVPAPRPSAPRDTDPTVLQALAAGCVVVLPERYRPTYGDAAVYCEPADLAPVVAQLHARPAEFLRQSRTGTEFARRRHGHERYAEQVAALRR